MHSYLKEQRAIAFTDLEDEFYYSDWLRLAQTTLTSVQLFNRRRAGEIERVSIEDFQNYEGVNADEMRRLDIDNQAIACYYARFTIRGKLNRTVPVLLTADLKRCIHKILEHPHPRDVRVFCEYISCSYNQ